MLSWVIQQVVISLVVIVLIHSIYNFLQLNLTTPKVRDLVNKPRKQYEEMYKTFKESEDKNNGNVDMNQNNSDTNESLMKSELQNYLKELSTENKMQNKQNQQKENQKDLITNELQPASFSDNFTPAYETF